MNTIIVVAALIENEDKVLLARRATGSESVLGKWEFPGGKVEAGEDEMHAIEREMFEEFDVKVKALEFVISNVCQYPEKIVDLRLYRCKYIEGEFKLHDHYEYKWVSLDEILNYELCPADIPLANYVKMIRE